VNAATSNSVGAAAAAGKPNVKSGPPASAGRKQVKPADPAQGRSREAKCTAAAILEVLAGSRTPSEAAEALATSLPRYYLLEARALAGLVAACEPRPRGRTHTSERELAAVRRECERLRREASRQQALARAAQRTIGLSLPEKPKPKAAGGKRRRRRPTARALRAAERLRTDADPPPTTPTPTPTVAASM
jgi:hypothetical protein